MNPLLRLWRLFFGPPEINGRGLALIKKYEGLRLTPYQDVNRAWKIGYGCPLGSLSHPITSAQAEVILKKTLYQFEKDVYSLVSVKLNPNQYAALVSFCFNLGTTRFENSTLLILLNKAQYGDAAAQFLRWDHVGAEKNLKLLERRQAEMALFIDKNIYE